MPEIDDAAFHGACSGCDRSTKLWFCVKLCDNCINEKVAEFKASGRPPIDICGADGSTHTGGDCGVLVDPMSVSGTTTARPATRPGQTTATPCSVDARNEESGRNTMDVLESAAHRLALVNETIDEMIDRTWENDDPKITKSTRDTAEILGMEAGEVWKIMEVRSLVAARNMLVKRLRQIENQESKGN